MFRRHSPSSAKTDLGAPPRRNRRPLSGAQEAVVLGAAFVVAMVFQLAVLLEFSSIVAW